jgi:hypothetical protein
MLRRDSLHLIGRAALLPLLSGLPALAANDPRPEAPLAAVLGEWRGSLTYRDVSTPDRMVTLPTRLFVSAVAPDEIALHYVHDDGPGKTVFGYERMRFEFASNTLLWISGAVEKTALVGRIVASDNATGVHRYVVETTKDRALSRYTMEFGARSLSLQKDEVAAGGQAQMRNRYAFAR